MTNWNRVPGPVIGLLRRLKDIEHSDGSWPGSDTVNTVNRWLTDHGVAPETPAEDLPPADDPPHRYRRLVEVECTSHWPLDATDLDHAITGAVTGTGVRVEHADLAETIWVELTATAATKPPR
ncbi:hypothetical protein [Actinomadura sp. WMMA1423]|uniref:hypothetical protein n=1 Tax=Actinomadura sp. WMMA1423 TaxID=2591108 RepID=UPI00143D7D09|nr:hypothetical protein [Actinomadura sp. WMMA1423]